LADAVTTAATCDLILTGARVVSVVPSKALYWPGSVAIRDGVILAVGPSQDVDERFAAARHVRCDGDILMPGFVNAHLHAGMSLLKGYPCDYALSERLKHVVWPFMAAMDEQATGVAVRAACAESISAGITTFADMFPFVAATAHAVRDTGLRARLAPYLMTESDELARAVRDVSSLGCPRVTAAVGVQSLYGASVSALEQAADIARSEKLPVHIHVAETRAEFDQGMGVRAVARRGLMPKGSILAHAIHVDAEEIAQIAQRGAGVAHNPSANAKLGTGIANISAYRSVGIPVGLGSDSVAANDRLDLFEEMRMAVFLSRLRRDEATPLSIWDAIEMATLGGAQVLGLDQTIGSLEPGKAADLIRIRLGAPHLEPLLDNDREQVAAHIVFAARPADVSMVMVDGDVLLDSSVFTKLDAAMVMQAATAAAARVLGRAGLA
jgi:5-methylthioadenosine/S-adenosylhomocysteine deaminase